MSKELLPVDAVAEWDYEPSDAEELGVKKGQRIQIVDMGVDWGWVIGQDQAGKLGLVPMTHLRVIGREKRSQDQEEQVLSLQAPSVPRPAQPSSSTDTKSPAGDVKGGGGVVNAGEGGGEEEESVVEERKKQK